MDRACQDCDWCHNFWTHGYCENRAVKQPPDNVLTESDLVTDNDCPGFDDDSWSK